MDQAFREEGCRIVAVENQESVKGPLQAKRMHPFQLRPLDEAEPAKARGFPEQVEHLPGCVHETHGNFRRGVFPIPVHLFREIRPEEIRLLQREPYERAGLRRARWRS